jgi:hypothetical protein
MKDDELVDVIAEGQVVGGRTPLGGVRLAPPGPVDLRVAVGDGVVVGGLGDVA